MNEWISIKDQLPNHMDLVICKNARSNPEVSLFKMTLNQKNEPSEYFFMASNEWKQYTGVTHWRYLPEIPGDD